MKNPFRLFRSSAEKAPAATEQEQKDTERTPAPAAEEPQPEPEIKKEPEDSFVEWRRTKVYGGIERRERNDFYEEYSVYGADSDQLICRRFHRYPEHEREFGLSYTRQLSFDEFNRRLLSELDRAGMSLEDYHACIAKAEALTAQPDPGVPSFGGFEEAEEAAIKEFCESMDNLTDKEYRRGEGIFRCACRSAVGDDMLNLWFRKPLAHDAADGRVSGVSRAPVESYDIENLWIMGVCNRLKEHCGSCRITRLTSEWSMDRESVYLITAEGFPGTEGTLMIAVSDSAAFPRFGFYSLDFSRK